MLRALICGVIIKEPAIYASPYHFMFFVATLLSSCIIFLQHVLEHGKPHERSTIIKELAGKIVQMSQQKFASNVVEKCLTFGGPAERQLLVVEMLGTTDENEPLQVCSSQFNDPCYAYFICILIFLQVYGIGVMVLISKHVFGGCLWDLVVT